MKASIIEFFKEANVYDVRANKKELFIMVYCYDMEVKINYNSGGILTQDLVFLNKCRRNEF